MTKNIFRYEDLLPFWLILIYIPLGITENTIHVSRFENSLWFYFGYLAW